MEQWQQSWRQHWRRLRYRGSRFYQKSSDLAIAMARPPLQLLERVPAGPMRNAALLGLFVVACLVPLLLRPLSVGLGAFFQIFWSLGVMAVGLAIAFVYFLVEKEQDALANGLLGTERKRYSEVPIARYQSFERWVDFGSLLVACVGMIVAFGFLSQGIYDVGLTRWYHVRSGTPHLGTWQLYAFGSVFRALDIFNVFSGVKGLSVVVSKGVVTAALVFFFKAIFDILLLAKIRDWWSKRGLVLEAIPALAHDETRKKAEETLRRCRKYAIPHLVDTYHNSNKTPVQRSALRLLHDLRYDELVPLLLDAQASKEEALRKEAAQLLGWSGAQHPQAAVEGLARALKDPSAEVRAEAASQLGLPEAQARATSLLLDAVNDPAASVRENALCALQLLTSPETRQPVLDALKDKDSQVRKAAVAAVAQFEEEILPSLAPMLDDPNKDVRAAVIAAVAEQLEREPDAATTCLLEALKDDDQANRVEIISHLRWQQSTSAIPRLAELLKEDRSSEVRQAAAETLGYMETKKAIGPLHEALGDRHYQVRCQVIEALGDLRARDAVGDIVGLLSDGDRDVRKQAATTLGELRVSEPHVLTALEAGLSDTDWQVRAACVEALSELTDGKAPAMAGALGDEHASVREAAIRALSSPIEAAFVPLMLARLQDTKETRDVRKAAVDAISFYNAQNWDAIAAQVTPLLPALLHDDDMEVRKAMIEAIGTVGFAGSHELIIPFLQHEESELRLTATEALAFIKAPEALRALIDALRDDNLRVRAAAAEAIGEFAERGDVSEAVGPLLSALQDSEQEVRKNAALALALVGADEAQQALLDALSASELQVRVAALEALGIRMLEGELQAPQIQTICAALRGQLHDKEKDIRVAAAEALGRGQEPQSTPANVDALCEVLRKDADDWVRFTAAYSLKELGSEQSIAALEEALQKDDDEYVRATAADALGELQADSSGPLLRQALTSDREPYVRQSAAKALAASGDPSHEAFLARVLLDEQSAEVRHAIVGAFDDVESPALMDTLRQAFAQERDPRLRRKLYKLIQRKA